MAADNAAVLRIGSEDEAWAALRWLLDNRRAAANAKLEIVNLDWGKVHFAYRGAVFHQTVTPSTMRGMIEYQNDIYRSLARVIKNDGRVIRLTDAEKSAFELVFKVEEGSSDFFASASGLMNSMKGAVEKLTGRQALIAIIILLISFFGTAGVWMYFNHTVEIKKIEAEEKDREFDIEERKDLFEFLQKVMEDKDAQTKTIGMAIKASPGAKDIIEYNRHGYDEVVRATSGVDELVLQGTVVSATVIKEITRSNRANSEKWSKKGTFTVTGVESDDPGSFMVHLTSTDDEGDLVAELEDPLVSSRYQRAISNAEWSGKPVMVHLVGRQVGGTIKDAKITKAYAPRVRRT